MARKAYLIGVCKYRGDVLTPLPVIRNDFLALQKALEARGFEVETFGVDDRALGDFTQAPSRNSVLGWVGRALSAAAPADELLFFLSGHGANIAGQDYLIPADVHLHETEFEEFLVTLDFSKYSSDTRATDVVFAVDACREGVELSTKGLSLWTKGKVTASRNRRVATIFACAPGQYSSFVAGAENGFSLFSRAFAEALVKATTEPFLDCLQRRLETLCMEYGKPPQQVRCRGEFTRGQNETDAVEWLVTGKQVEQFTLQPLALRFRQTEGEIWRHAHRYERQRCHCRADRFRADHEAAHEKIGGQRLGNAFVLPCGRRQTFVNCRLGTLSGAAPRLPTDREARMQLGVGLAQNGAGSGRPKGPPPIRGASGLSRASIRKNGGLFGVVQKTLCGCRDTPIRCAPMRRRSYQTGSAGNSECSSRIRQVSNAGHVDRQ